MNRAKLVRRKYIYRALMEDAVAASMTPMGNISNMSDEQLANLEAELKKMGTKNSEEQTTITADDVANMSPGDVIRYVYVDIPQNIDPQAKQALLTRADQIRKDAESGKDTKQRAEAILNSIKMTLPNLK